MGEKELTDLEMLKRARKRLSSESAWGKGHYDYGGRMCIVGACGGLFTPHAVRETLRNSVRKLYPSQLPEVRTLVRWNDLLEVTHEQVLAVLDDAISKCGLG